MHPIHHALGPTFASSSPNVDLIKGPKGDAVHALYDFKKGSLLFAGWGPRSTERTMYTIQIARDCHIVPASPMIFLNHSCEPNCGLLITDKIVEVHALQNIKAGEEITIDYATFEAKISSMPDCLCGKPSCRGTILGFADLPDAQREELRLKYDAFIAPHLLE